MFKRPLQSQRRQKHYRIKRGGYKEALIDRQVLVIHAAIADKLIAAHAKGERSYEENVKAVLEERYESGRMRYGEFLTWQSLLSLIGSASEFKQGMLEDSPQMNKYRRRTPFVGILTEEERMMALQHDAIGESGDALF